MDAEFYVCRGPELWTVDGWREPPAVVKTFLTVADAQAEIERACERCRQRREGDQKNAKGKPLCPWCRRVLGLSGRDAAPLRIRQVRRTRVQRLIADRPDLQRFMRDEE